VTAITRSHDCVMPRTEASARELEDSEALERARQGDHAAFRVLVERYEGRALVLARRILRDDERARDAVQDAFLKAYEALSQFEGRSAFYTWFYRVVYNRCLDLKRQSRHRPQARLPEDPLQAEALLGSGAEEGVGSSPYASPERARGQSELRSVVADALDCLPDGAREILVLREVEDLSYAEIAKLLGIPKGTVMSRLFHARRRLRDRLIEMGIQPATAGTKPSAKQGDRRE